MPRLSDSLTVKSLHLRNRLVMPPMVTGFAVESAPSVRQIEWYAEHARSGAGMIIVEASAIDPDAKLLPFMLGIWEDSQVSGLRSLAKAIQAEGVPAILQIVHGGARSWREDLGQERLGPSPVRLMPGPPPREMTGQEIEESMDSFAKAAKRAVDAGFDGVEIHAAHYYLLSQFMSPYSNRRTDAWGGDRERRSRFPLEVIRAIRAVVGKDYPLLCRMHALENFAEGMSTEDAIFFASLFAENGIDLLDASGVGTASVSSWEGFSYLTTSSVLPKDTAAGSYAPATARIRAALTIPVITVGKMAAPGLAQRVLEEGQADLIAIARQLIADPRTPEKILAGRDDEIQRCQECLVCFGAIRKGPLQCGVNRAL